ncbi:MAG TPA: helix-turn-helix domain-containing protein, partial [Ktedonobacteraceae bacterium]|nr:helix-turn-helix domain-containing protein [Ktedonobacteraceae bacterium]
MGKQMPWYERIKQARLERNLSQADLAKKLGASSKAIQRWEKGKNRPQPLWRGKLCEFFQLSSEELSFLPTRGMAVLASKGPVAVIEGDRVARPQRYIVGRQAEVQLFDELLSGQKDYHLLNIYGPGGMGKSVVCGKLRTHAHAHNVPTAVVDGSHPDLTPDSILDGFKQSLMEGPFKEQLEVGFREFESQLHEYSLVNYLMAQVRDVHTLFDTFGNIKDQSKFAALLAGLHENLPQSLERTIHNRFALDRYLRGAERALTTCFVRTLATLQEELRCSIALLID